MSLGCINLAPVALLCGYSMERAVIVSAAVTGLAGMNWPCAALAGGMVFVLIELTTRDEAVMERLSGWQVGPWRSVAVAAFIGAGQCCLGWSLGAGLRLLLVSQP